MMDIVPNFHRPSLLFIGSLDVAPTFGGPIQFHRHFVARNDFSFTKAIQPASERLHALRTGIPWLDRVVNRISHTRLFPHFVALNEWMSSRQAVAELLRTAEVLRPDAIVTVAFGAYGFAAARVARELDLPLITFFHDWWPDLALESRWGRRIFDRLTRRLYRESSLALCVCEGMRAELGTHPNAPVLFPISGPRPAAEKTRPRPARPRVVYFGSMTRGYGRMLSNLARAYLDRQEPAPWELVIIGDARDWDPSVARRATEAGILHRQSGYGESVAAELDAADIFLVVMDFEDATRRRVRTSFPSKLLDYAQYNRPIIAWAPAYSSLARFATNHGFPGLHAEPDAHTLIECIDRHAQDPSWMETQGAHARSFASGPFSPDRIHAQLVDCVQQAIRLKPPASAA